jgi:hypothetical protein
VIIVYTSPYEILVCTPESEPRLIKEWFFTSCEKSDDEGARNIDDYDRDTSDEAIMRMDRTSGCYTFS